MIESDMFTFSETPWEIATQKLSRGGSISAVRFLTLLEGEDEDVLTEAFETLEHLHVALELDELPKVDPDGEAALRLQRETELNAGGALLQSLSEGDPLRLYLEEIAQIPACRDTAALASRCAGGDGAAREALLQGSLYRVAELAQEYTGRGVLLLDLMQEGGMGLWQGILAYDGGDFDAVRDWWIRQYMARAAVTQARAGGVGQRLRQNLEDYRTADQRLLTALGRNPTLAEIADALGLTLEQTQAIAQTLENIRALDRVNDAVKQAEETKEEDNQAVEDTAYFQQRQRIEQMLSGLEGTDAELLKLRFGLEGGLPLTPEETGRRLGLAPEEVVAREGAALMRLRTAQG